MREYDPVSLKIMWDRLVSICDEIVLSLVRTSFSINVREGYDLSCILFDALGRTLAQGTYSVPSFTGTGPQTLRHMLNKFPPETLQPGDVLVTNDPWMGTGHLFDINIMRPAFRDGVLVGYTLSITHLPDIGGAGLDAASNEVYKEGLRLPVMKLVKAGTLNEELIDLIKTNVRVSDEVIGDIMANITCNEVGCRALVDFMGEYGIDDLEPLSDAINDHADHAMREEILGIPDGTYRNEIRIEGIDEPITLAATVKIAGETIDIDFTGTGGPVRAAINVPMCYTRAQSYYVIKCLTIPSLPNNSGAVRPIGVSAPEDCILNVQPPWPTGGRHATGHFIVPLLMGALAEAVPDRVISDVAMMTVFNIQGRHENGQDVASLFFLAGGFGALNGSDGPNATPAPSNMTVVPTEIWENLTSMTVEKRAMLCDSGGPGEFRGGAGQEVVFRNDTGNLLSVALFGQRTEFPARGFLGGGDGAKRQYLVNGAPVHAKGRYELAPGDTLTSIEAGAGGFGDPMARPVDKVARDVAEGVVSIEAARRDYGVEIDPATGAARRVGAAAE